MSLSSQNQSDRPADTNRQDGAYAAWGLIAGGVLGGIPALILGGRMYLVALLVATIGWVVGALIDRSKR